MRKIKVKGQTFQTGECSQASKQTDGRTDGRTIPNVLSPHLGWGVFSVFGSIERGFHFLLYCLTSNTWSSANHAMGTEASMQIEHVQTLRTGRIHFSAHSMISRPSGCTGQALNKEVRAHWVYLFPVLQVLTLWKSTAPCPLVWTRLRASRRKRITMASLCIVSVKCMRITLYITTEQWSARMAGAILMRHRVLLQRYTLWFFL